MHDQTPGAGSSRSRGTGCYTCRLRKVRCQGTRLQSHKCPTCERLGFDCRWQPPRPGESFSPPPKRRRAGSQRERTTHSNERFPETDGPTNDPVNLPMLMGGPFDQGVSSMDINASEADWTGFDFDAFLAEISAPFQQQSGPSGDAAFEMTVDPFSAASRFDRIVPSPSDPASTSPFSLDGEGQILVQHYLEVLKKYAKVEERSKDVGNVYVSAFSRALFLPLLLQAIFAYSSLHMSLKDPARAMVAERHNDIATRAILELQLMPDNEIDVEGSLAAIYIMVKRHHMAAARDTVKAYRGLLDLASRIVQLDKAQPLLFDPGSLSRSLVRRLAYHDCRMAMFGLGGGDFVEVMQSLASLSDLFGVSHMEPTDVGLDLLQANLTRLEVSRLHAEVDNFRNGTSARPPSLAFVDKLHQRIVAMIAQSPSEPLPPDTNIVPSPTYHRWIALSALHSSLIYLFYIYALPEYHPPDSIQWLLHHHLVLLRDPSRKNSPSAIWPTSLFLVGLMSKDEIHRDWIIRQLEEMQIWGNNHLRAANLLRHIWQTASNAKVPLDIKKAMEETGGLFIL